MVIMDSKNGPINRLYGSVYPGAKRVGRKDVTILLASSLIIDIAKFSKSEYANGPVVMTKIFE